MLTAHFRETVLGWSAGGKAASLLVPLVVSKNTCHSRHELSLLSAFHGLLPAPAPYWLPSPGSVPMGNTSIGGEHCMYIKSCVKSDTSSSRSHDSPHSFRSILLPSSSPALPQNARPRVIFNSYVQRSIIIDASVTGKEVVSGSETDTVSDLDPDEDEMLLKRMSRAFDSPSHSTDSGEDTDEEPLPVAPTLINSGIHMSVIVFIQALPPVQLFPKVEDSERGVKVIFVPPKGQGALREEDILPAKEQQLPPAKLQRTLSSHDLATMIKNEEAEMNLGEMGGTKRHGAHSPGGNTPEGWLLLDCADGSSDDELFLPTVTNRRRLREKRTKEAKAKARFSLGDEEDEDGEGGGLCNGWNQVTSDEKQWEARDSAASGIAGRSTEPQIQTGIQVRTLTRPWSTADGL
jgi:hypothetical protein